MEKKSYLHQIGQKLQHFENFMKYKKRVNFKKTLSEFSFEQCFGICITNLTLKISSKNGQGTQILFFPKNKSLLQKSMISHKILSETSLSIDEKQP